MAGAGMFGTKVFNQDFDSWKKSRDLRPPIVEQKEAKTMNKVSTVINPLVINPLPSTEPRIPWTEDDVVDAIHDPSHAIWEDCSENRTSLIAVREIMINIYETTKSRVADMKDKFAIRERAIGGVDGGSEWLDEIEEFLSKKQRTNNFLFAVKHGLTRLKVIWQELVMAADERNKREKAERKKAHKERLEADRLKSGKVKNVNKTTQDHLNEKEVEAKMWRDLCCQLAMAVMQIDQKKCHEILQTKVPWGKGGEMTLEQVAIETSHRKGW